MDFLYVLVSRADVLKGSNHRALFLDPQNATNRGWPVLSDAVNEPNIAIHEVKQDAHRLTITRGLSSVIRFGDERVWRFSVIRDSYRPDARFKGVIAN